jgi:hypothetical protein
VPAFRVHGKTVAGFAAFKTHLSYLPFSGSVLGQLAGELDGYTMTKSSLHFTADRPLPKALVNRPIALRLADASRRPEAACHSGRGKRRSAVSFGHRRLPLGLLTRWPLSANPDQARLIMCCGSK